jgi:hypothetical protein
VDTIENIKLRLSRYWVLKGLTKEDMKAALLRSSDETLTAMDKLNQHLCGTGDVPMFPPAEYMEGFGEPIRFGPTLIRVKPAADALEESMRRAT